MPVDELQGKGIVIEPITGLPMNVGKYGTGHGGIDGSETIEGFRKESAVAAAPGESETDWDAVKKSNTIY